MIRMIYRITLVVSVVLVSGCAPMNVEPEAGQPEGTAPLETSLPVTLPAENVPPTGTAPAEEGAPVGNTPEAVAPELYSGEVPADLFETILDDLLSRTGRDRAEIEVIKAEAVTWPDGSIGCPQPDMMYTQALVDGYQVIFASNGQAYDYHLSQSGFFVLCQNGLPSKPIIEPPTQ